MGYVDYTDPVSAQDFWFKEIAPKYFNFNVANLHRTGIFGYVNETMSTVENDTAHAVSIARREFYPTTARYTKSLYKMAALQQISYPFANPAQATAILLMQESEILKYGETREGVTTFVLDNNMVITADNIPFLLDFPVRITAKEWKIGKTILHVNQENVDSKSRYAYTVKYDAQFKNDINKVNTKYITSRTVSYNGEVYLLFKVSLHQCTETIMSASISTSPILNNITLDFPFTGKICNFEVFYNESEDATTYQLTKIPLNANPINGKFCMYSLVDDQTLRLTFPENAYFNPRFNSSIRVKIYTTLGSEGNFPSYKGTLECTPNSERYAYNNMCSITGQIQGSSIGGTDMPSQDDFRNDVIAAYATNKTITTENDLQIYFDSVMTDTRNKVIFQKKRDDVFERLYAAYMIIKDLEGNIVPTNSLTLEIKESQVDTLFESHGRAIIKPGKVFRYQDDEHFYVSGTSVPSYYNLYDTGANLTTDINDNVTDFCYTNIFLMQIMKSPNMVGFYLNTVNDTVGLDFVKCDDAFSYVQFNVSSFNIKRNAIRGENFYKISCNVQPSIVDSGLDLLAILKEEELPDTQIFPLEIRAEYDGIVEKFEYRDIEGTNQSGSVFMVIRYTPDIPGVTRQTLTKYVQESGMPNDIDNPDDLRIWIRINAPVNITTDADGNKIYDTPAWYATNLQAGDVFTAGSIIATRKPKDTGIIRVIAELRGDTYGRYIPMTIEDYDETIDAYTFSAYLSTNDVMTNEGRLQIVNGFADASSGEYHDYVAIDPTDCSVSISTFVQYFDQNSEHAYRNYAYLKHHSFTNKFETTTDTFNFMVPFKFIRSTVSYNQMITSEGEDETTPEYFFKLTNIPLIRSNWVKNIGNVFDLVEILRRNHDYLLQVYDLLENNYSIDMKFFNTYGKSRFFRIGIREDTEVMDKVNIVPYFGIKLNILSPYEEFRGRFVKFVREYIESFNEVSNRGNSIYLMDLVTAIRNNFTEIERLEFYGIDNYSVSGAQHIEALSDEEIRRLRYNEYVPEFINVYCDYYDNKLEPKVDITILE